MEWKSERRSIQTSSEEGSSPSSHPTKEAYHALSGKRAAAASGLMRGEIAHVLLTKKRTWSEQRDRRVAVAEIFKNHLGFPQKDLWYGHGGTISKIQTIYPDISRNTVDSILKDIYNSEHGGKMYTGQRQNCSFLVLILLNLDRRLNLVKLKIAKKPQGGNDANSNCAKASFNWSKQLAI